MPARSGNQRRNRTGGSAGAGGYDYQAEIFALVAAKMLAGEACNLAETGCDRLPRCIEHETGNGGDDLRVILRSGRSIDVQAKHGLRRGPELWAALEGMARWIEGRPHAFATLVTDTTASSSIRTDLRAGLLALGHHGVEAPEPLPQIASEFRYRLEAWHLSVKDVCRRLGIQVRDLDTGSSGEDDTDRALRNVVAATKQVGAARRLLVAVCFDLMKQRGRCDAADLRRELTQAGIELSHSTGGESRADGAGRHHNGCAMAPHPEQMSGSPGPETFKGAEHEPFPWGADLAVVGLCLLAEHLGGDDRAAPSEKARFLYRELRGSVVGALARDSKAPCTLQIAQSLPPELSRVQFQAKTQLQLAEAPLGVLWKRAVRDDERWCAQVPCLCRYAGIKDLPDPSSLAEQRRLQDLCELLGDDGPTPGAPPGELDGPLNDLRRATQGVRLAEHQVRAQAAEAAEGGKPWPEGALGDALEPLHHQWEAAYASFAQEALPKLRAKGAARCQHCKNMPPWAYGMMVRVDPATFAPLHHNALLLERVVELIGNAPGAKYNLATKDASRTTLTRLTAGTTRSAARSGDPCRMATAKVGISAFDFEVMGIGEFTEERVVTSWSECPCSVAHAAGCDHSRALHYAPPQQLRHAMENHLDRLFRNPTILPTWRVDNDSFKTVAIYPERTGDTTYLKFDFCHSRWHYFLGTNIAATRDPALAEILAGSPESGLDLRASPFANNLGISVAVVDSTTKRLIRAIRDQVVIHAGMRSIAVGTQLHADDDRHKDAKTGKPDIFAAAYTELANEAGLSRSDVRKLFLAGWGIGRRTGIPEAIFVCDSRKPLEAVRDAVVRARVPHWEEFDRRRMRDCIVTVRELVEDLVDHTDQWEPEAGVACCLALDYLSPGAASLDVLCPGTSETPERFDAFVCHASQDKMAVRELVRRLCEEGVRVWLDEDQIQLGDSIPEKIASGLGRSSWIVVCLSPDLGRSNWCRREYGPAIAREAQGKGTRIIPVVIKAVGDHEIPELLYDRLRVTDPDDPDQFAALVQRLMA